MQQIGLKAEGRDMSSVWFGFGWRSSVTCVCISSHMFVQYAFGNVTCNGLTPCHGDLELQVIELPSTCVHIIISADTSKAAVFT